MKKVLLATTALALSAGVASAEISLSGDARIFASSIEGNNSVTLERRARIHIAGSMETENGLTFGATLRADQAADALDGNDKREGTVYVSGAFGKLTFGSSSSAAELAVGDLAGVGVTGAGGGNENKYYQAGNVLYTYSMGAITVHASVGESADTGGNTVDFDEASLGVSYVAGNVTVAVGYENGADSHLIGGLTYAMGDTKVKAVYGKMGNDSQMGVSATHAMGAISLAGFYRTTEVGGADLDYYGIGAAYDLGGGASAKAGYADNNGTATVEAGVSFSF
jgi:outer membrane protein OmpU